MEHPYHIGRLEIHSFAHRSLLFAQSAHFKNQFAHIALYNRALVSNWLFEKEQCEWFPHDSSQSLTNNKRIAQNIRIFSMFWQFFLFLCPKPNCSHRSLLNCTFLKSDLSYSLSSLFTKEWLWAIYSGHSSHDKRATVSDSLRPLITKKWLEWFALFLEQIAFLLTKIERIAPKRQMSKFPTLHIGRFQPHWVLVIFLDLSEFYILIS